MTKILQQTPAQWSQIYADGNVKIEVNVATADQFQQNNSPDALQTKVRVTPLNSQITLNSLTLVGALRNNTSGNLGFSVTLDQSQNDFSSISSSKSFTVSQAVTVNAPWVSDPFPTWVKRNSDGVTANLGFYINSLSYSVSSDQSSMTDPNPNSSTTQLF